MRDYARLLLAACSLTLDLPHESNVQLRYEQADDPLDGKR